MKGIKALGADAISTPAWVSLKSIINETGGIIYRREVLVSHWKHLETTFTRHPRCGMFPTR